MKFRWMNIRTGEVVETVWDMIKTEVYDIIHYRFVGIWKYSRRGF